MARWKNLFGCVLALGVMLTLAGCGGGEETAPADGDEAAMAEEHAHEGEHEHEGEHGHEGEHADGDAEHAHAEGDDDTEHAHAEGEEDDEAMEQQRIVDNMATLSEEDRALAMAQKVCPVGGELGSMGTPMKVTVGDRDVFICCEACKKPLLEDPDTYLAKLDAPAEGEEAEETTE